MKRMILVVTMITLFPLIARAHCDTLGGPVISDARLALEKGDVTPVLKWIKKENEAEIRDTFAKTLMVRQKGAEARDLADQYFFETLVRVHRMGEGAPFTGLKPAGSLEPQIQAVDDALLKGSLDDLMQAVTDGVHSEIRERFERVQAAKKNADASVEQGRAYVEAYVGFLHYVERLNDAAKSQHESEGELKHEN